MRVSIANASDGDAAYSIIVDCREALEARRILQWDAQYPSRTFFDEAIVARHLFVLREEERVMGVAVLDDCQPPEWSSAAWVYQDVPFAVIHAFAVSPRAQGRGHGKFLLACCEDAAKKRGGKAIRLDVFSENPDALRFYAHHGYSFRGDVRFASKPLGHQRYLCYEKLLDCGDDAPIFRAGAP